MIPLIITVLLSGALIILMIVFRNYQIDSWMCLIDSKYCKKGDLFFENLFEFLKNKLEIGLNLIRKILMNLLIIGKEIIIWVKKVFNLILKKIIKKTSNQINKLETSKLINNPSDYLKNIEEYKNGIKEEREDF